MEYIRNCDFSCDGEACSAPLGVGKYILWQLDHTHCITPLALSKKSEKLLVKIVRFGMRVFPVFLSSGKKDLAKR